MPLNVGYIEVGYREDVRVRVYYDTAFTPIGDDQPLIDGPRGYCLDVTNVSGRNVRVSLTSPSGTITANVNQGDPVTNGQARSRTAAQLAGLGFATRGDVSDFSLGPA